MTVLMISSLLQKFLGDRARLGRILIQSYLRFRVIKEQPFRNDDEIRGISFPYITESL